MKRIILLALALIVAVAAVVSFGGCGSSDPYLVRAAFDTAGYTVSGEDVRINGANVGSIQSVTVAMPGERISEDHGQLVPAPGKAIVVLKIDNPAFQDFRADATCQIRQQALIGARTCYRASHRR